MDRQARIGMWMVIGVIAVSALGEASLLAVNILAGRFTGMQAARIVLTVLLLWRVWDGASWARWLLAVLCLAGAVLAFVAGFGTSVAADHPEALLVVGVIIAVSLGMAVFLASPPVGAFQEARRGER